MLLFPDLVGMLTKRCWLRCVSLSNEQSSDSVSSAVGDEREEQEGMLSGVV